MVLYESNDLWFRTNYLRSRNNSSLSELETPPSGDNQGFVAFLLSVIPNFLTNVNLSQRQQVDLGREVTITVS